MKKERESSARLTFFFVSFLGLGLLRASVVTSQKEPAATVAVFLFPLKANISMIKGWLADGKTGEKGKGESAGTF